MEVSKVVPEKETVIQYTFYPLEGAPDFMEVFPAQGDTAYYSGEAPYRTLTFSYPRLKFKRSFNTWQYRSIAEDEQERIYFDNAETLKKLLRERYAEELRKREPVKVADVESLHTSENQ